MVILVMDLLVRLDASELNEHVWMSADRVTVGVVLLTCSLVLVKAV